MATVTFSNGKSAEFQGTPTPQDIDYVAHQMGITAENNSSATDKALGAGKWLLNAVASPAENAGMHLAQLSGRTTDAMGLTHGLEQKMNDKMAAMGNKNLTGGDVAPLNEGWRSVPQLAGDAGSIATSLYTPETAGLAKMVGLGMASGASQSLSGGNTDIGKVAGDSVSGGLYSGILGIGGSLLARGGNVSKEMSGITPSIEKEMRGATPDAIDLYHNNTIMHEADSSHPGAYATSARELKNRATTLIKTVIPQAGSILGKLRDKAMNMPVMMKPPDGPVFAGIDAVTHAVDDINNSMQKLTHHQFSEYAGGGSGAIPIQNYKEGASTSGIYQGLDNEVVPVPGRQVDLTKNEKDQLNYLSGEMQKLRDNPTVATAMDVVDNLNKQVGSWKNPQFGDPSSPVKLVMKDAYHTVSQLIKSTSPEIEAATSHYHELSNLRSDLGREMGNNGQNASHMMRSVSSGDQADDVIPLLHKLDAVTTPFRTKEDATSLVAHGHLADWATSIYGSETAQTKFQQHSGGRGGDTLWGDFKNWSKIPVQELYQHTLPDPAKFAKSIARGDPESTNFIARFAQNAMNSSEALPLIGKVTKSLNDHGLNPNLAVPITMKLMKVALFNRLTNPNQQNQQDQ